MPLNIHNTSLAVTAGLRKQLVHDGLAQVAFSGRSNVGKSSLVNSLLGRKKLARVSGEPGKTITVNYYNVDKKLYLVDLPGYGYARRSKESAAKWQSLTQEYFENNDDLKLVLQLADIKVGFTNDDRMMLDFMNYYDVPYIIVATKCDKLGTTALGEKAQEIISDRSLRPGTGIVLYSSTKHTGREDLWKIITDYAGE